MEIYHRLDQYPMATTMFAEIEANRPPDIQGPDWTADAGGNAKAREAWIGDLIQLGKVESAEEILTSLERVGTFPTLRGQLGLPERPNHVWRATLHPEEDFVVSPLQGPDWSLSDHRGDVVLLSFWATWCQPCRKELPELVELQQELSEQGFQLLAISVDDDNAQTLEEVAKYAQKLGIPSQVAHAPDLGKRFSVDAIPALRLLGKNGELRYEAKGYSKTALERLENRIDDVLEDPHDGASPIGAVWDESPAKLLKFVPLADADAIWADAEHIVVSVQGASPAIFTANGDMLSAPDGSEGYTWATQMVAWLDGPIGSDRGKHWIRAWDADGMTRWLITTPSPVQALIRADDKIWVATQNQVLVIDADGTVVAQADGQYSSLLYDDGQVWAGNDASSWQLSMHPASTDAGPHIVPTQKSAGGATLGPNGIRAGAVVSQVLTGRFGPNGESRLVVARPDGVVIGFAKQYRPTFLLSLDQTVRLAHTDSDKNGKDELLISVTNQGLAIVDLTLP